MFLKGPREVVKSFESLNAKVVFSAEAFCWPDLSLAVSFSHYLSNCH